MKVVHIESGLGNQMLSYSELLLLKKLNNDDCYIETIIYEIPECNKIISQWYGYELSRIFNINTPDIHSLFSSEEWKNVISDVRKTEFWKNWNYPTVIVNALNKYGLNLVNYRGNVDLTVHNSWKSKITNNRVGYFIKRVLRPLYQDSYIKKMSNKKEMFLKTSDNAYTGQWLGLMKVDSGIEFIEDDIRKIFQFPKLEGKRNLELEKLIKTTNSVAIHARRGDALGTNGYCYKYGYFKRAIKYIKKKVENPIFIFFTDPGSIQWCKENEKIFGLDFREDRVMFVDWNGGEDSYRDMQLMSYCKHNVITFSSFGWWGSWLNENPEKITISPSVWINTTNHF